jgi:hypothetical protein
MLTFLQDFPMCNSMQPMKHHSVFMQGNWMGTHGEGKVWVAFSTNLANRNVVYLCYGSTVQLLYTDGFDPPVTFLQWLCHSDPSDISFSSAASDSPTVTYSGWAKWQGPWGWQLWCHGCCSGSGSQNTEVNRQYSTMGGHAVPVSSVYSNISIWEAIWCSEASQACFCWVRHQWSIWLMLANTLALFDTFSHLVGFWQIVAILSKVLLIRSI